MANDRPNSQNAKGSGRGVTFGPLPSISEDAPLPRGGPNITPKTAVGRCVAAKLSSKLDQLKQGLGSTKEVADRLYSFHVLSASEYREIQEAEEPSTVADIIIAAICRKNCIPAFVRILEMTDNRHIIEEILNKI